MSIFYLLTLTLFVVVMVRGPRDTRWRAAGLLAATISVELVLWFHSFNNF